MAIPSFRLVKRLSNREDQKHVIKFIYSWHILLYNPQLMQVYHPRRNPPVNTRSSLQEGWGKGQFTDSDEMREVMRVQDAPQDGDCDIWQAGLCELGTQEVDGATVERGLGRALWRA
jgi:hypothetical protein